jgi:hypothetical protein
MSETEVLAEILFQLLSVCGVGRTASTEGAMKYLLALLISLSAAPVWAGVVADCREAFPLPEERQERLACINALSQAQVAEQYRLMGLEQARQYANGLALFGTGPALINGINQGFRQMQSHPYVLPMPVQPR